MTSEYRERIRGSLEEDLDSLQYTYNQHFAVANANRWFGRITDGAIFLISGALLVREVTVGLERWLLITLLLVTATITALHRAMKPGEHETAFRNSAHAHQDLFKRGRTFLQLDLMSDDITDDEARAQYDELLEEYLELNRESPDASSFWYQYTKYVKGEEKMEEEITTTNEKRRALWDDASE